MKIPLRLLPLGLFLALLVAPAPLAAQDSGVPAPTPTPAAAPAVKPETPEPTPETPQVVRPPGGSRIINFPSADTPPPHILQLTFTHRFSDPVQDSNIHNLFSFDSGAEVGIGLSYTPIKNLEVGLLRERTLEDYELSAKYSILSDTAPVHVAVRAGGDWRTQKTYYPNGRFTFFAQAVAGVSLFDRVRVSVIPTFVTRAAGQLFILPIRDDIFNVLFAVSAALTRTINIQGELVPRTAQSPGTGWIVAIEKVLPKHRFSFTAGNMKPTTVDQYIAPDFDGRPRSNVYLGFNIIRQWKL